MRLNNVWRVLWVLAVCALAPPVLALDGAVPAINGHISRTLLGDGTGVVIGIVDSGIDDLHPALAGLDSLGNARLVAESNFVTTEPANTGDDVFGHGTWVASAALGKHATFSGMATDARYVNARVLNNTNGFPNDTPVRNGIGYAIDQGADVLNLSLNFFAPVSSGNSQLDLMVDWAAFEQKISCAVCVGNISTGNGSSLVRGPGSAFNGVTVGRTTADFTLVNSDSATAFTADGRMKPDVVAPGTALTLANDDWEGAGADWDNNLGGCSFATPLVAGLMAQQIEAGLLRGLSTDPLVVKATMMNSASKSVLNKQGNPWAAAQIADVAGVLTATRSLDPHSGAGQIDGAALAAQYLAGEKPPGIVDAIGWDLHTIGDGQFVDYVIDSNLLLGSTLSATLTWYRHVGRTDNGNGIVDAGDSFFLQQALSNLNLQVLRNGDLVAESLSGRDNVEHLFLNIDEAAEYTLRVFGARVLGGAEQFALAWTSIAVPEPSGAVMVLGVCLAVASVRRRS